MPSPDQYKEVEAKVINRKMPSYSINKSPRKTGFAEIVASAEKRSMVGPGTFDPKQMKEKILGSYGGKSERVTPVHSVIMEANEVPAMNKYNMTKFDVTN